MKSYQIGIYKGSDDKDFNDFLKESYFRIKNKEDATKVYNYVREVLGEERLISICKHKKHDLYIVRVFDAVSNLVNVYEPQKDQKGIYVEI